MAKYTSGFPIELLLIHCPKIGKPRWNDRNSICFQSSPTQKKGTKPIQFRAFPIIIKRDLFRWFQCFFQSVGYIQ